jgi:hypothetical protein
MTNTQEFLKRTLKAAHQSLRLKPSYYGDTIEFGATWKSRLADDETTLVSSEPGTQVQYFIMRLEGQSHNMAEMLATRSFPGVKTDSVFNEGRFSGSDQFAQCPAKGTWLRAQAEAAGVNPAGKYYLSGLADFPGDPTAWVSDRGDVLRVAEAKNLTIRDGYVSHYAHETEPLPDVTVADDIIEREVDRTLWENPGARREDVRDAVYTLRSGREDPNPLLVDDYFESDIAATV